jgi:ornithine carbamoyltransferase
MKRDLLTVLDLTLDEIHALLARAQGMKQQWLQGKLQPTLTFKTLGLLFVKPSTRTRISFEAAMHRLGGQCIFMTPQDTQLSRHEPLADTARVLSRYIEALVVRTFAQADVEELARHASIPVINGLTDNSHPCQVLSDLLTIREKRGTLDNLRVAWVGDGNNVAHSWINAAVRLGFSLLLACPPGYLPDAQVLEVARAQGRDDIVLVDTPEQAVASADAINTDVWTSMGQEQESEIRRSLFGPYQVNARLLDCAPSHAIVMHCLPAHRGEEITTEVMEGPRSVVFDQAENRLYFQMALLEWLLYK